MAGFIPNAPVIWPITMKKKLVLLLPICLGGCSLEEYKAKKHIIDTKWSCVDTTYTPHCSYELSVYKDSYDSFTIKTPSKLPANTKRQWTKK